MLVLTIILLISTTVLGIIFFGLFCWAVKDGQFTDSEEAKYVIFREDEAHPARVIDGGKSNGKKK